LFDASLCAAEDLQQMGDLCRKLVECQLEVLRQLGLASDLELLFADGYCRPNWDIVGDPDEEAQQLVREIFVSAHDVARGAEDELGARPN
jgi:hypothetical protein